jgi:hypothetical protein
MSRSAFVPESPARAPSVVRRSRRAAADSLWAVNERLAKAEQELRIQFIRIAQLQAQLDLLVGKARRSP